MAGLQLRRIRWQFGLRTLGVMVLLVAALCYWLHGAYRQWQAVRRMESFGARVYLSNMAVPQERVYDRVLDFPAALPLDRGTWSDFSRHLWHHVIAFDCTHYNEWVSGPKPPKSRLKEYLQDLPRVKTIHAWMGPCGCAQVSLFLEPPEHVPVLHYTFSKSFTLQLGRLLAQGFRAKKLDSTDIFNIAEILAANDLRGVN